MEDGKNLALVATRQVTRPQFEHAYVSRHIIEIKACSHDRNTQIFPLFICGSDGELALSSGEMPNLNPGILAKLAKALGLKLNNCTRQLGKDDELSPLRLFNFAYAILHCPSYRERYFEFLRSDFPRLPLTGNMDLFRALARLGGELTALHLLESPKLDKPMTKFVGSSREVVKIGWVDDTVWINAGGKKAATTAGTSGFQGVPEAVWNFHIGGYQVCEKWLKDRKGRTLTDEDIAHYHKIVISLTETIRLMSEIDQVINTHGGWPGAFASDSAVSPT
jgi:predicted helicase